MPVQVIWRFVAVARSTYERFHWHCHIGICTAPLGVHASINFFVCRQLVNHCRWNLPSRWFERLWRHDWLGYCEDVLAGIDLRLADRLQSFLNAAARILLGGTRRDHITPLIRDKLHWLRFNQRVTYKLCIMVYKCWIGCAPRYLCELVMPVADNVNTPQLRSADSLRIEQPRTRLKFGDRGCSAAPPEAWNSLPFHVTSAFCTHFKHVCLQT